MQGDGMKFNTPNRSGMSLQSLAWITEFGREYTDRNLKSVEEMDAMYVDRYGIPRSEMNKRFLNNLDRSVKILEVGSNIGLQLQFLQRMGFVNLYGIEILPYAVELSKSRTEGINIIQGNALDIPFQGGWFDLIFTSGLLIHIPPKDLPIVIEEIIRCTNRYIWGFEYYAEKLTQVQYRESEQTDELLWKADFPKIYCNLGNTLKLVKSEKFKVSGTDYEDIMFLLE